ncbi:MAG: hypothetical protein Q8M92_07520 [Candidatus Subteraquimicrobiales bacterium]|nr:hypothetical protein [Candidatus Subteraquimicrobiales bacterium]
MKEYNAGRRSFLKYLIALGAFGITSLLGFKKEEGFYVGKRKGFKVGTPEASGECGMAYDCAGGGGKCGMAYNCAGGGQDGGSSGGGSGKCGMAYDCAGGGGKCGMAYNCTGN